MWLMNLNRKVMYDTHINVGLKQTGSADTAKRSL